MVPGVFLKDPVMKPVSRHHVSKHKSAKKFRKHSHRVKAANMAPDPMRGGFRF